MYAKLLAEDKAGFEHLAEAYTVLSEDLSFSRVICLAKSVPVAALYLVHTSARTGVDAVTHARADVFPIYAERCTSTCCSRRRLQAPERTDLPHRSIAETSGRSESAVERHAVRRPAMCRHRRILLPVVGQIDRQSHRR
jgi:hypothetical protein